MPSIELPEDPQILRRIARLLEDANEWRSSASVLATLASRAPRDWRLALRYAIALENAGDLAMAREVVSAQLLGSDLRPRRVGILDQLLSQERVDLAAAVLEPFARKDPKGLTSYIANAWGRPVERALLQACKASTPDWAPLQLRLSMVEASENIGATAQADRMYAEIESQLAIEPSLEAPSPTPSTRMFRNPTLLNCLVLAAEFMLRTRDRVRIHVAACSSGEEVYSLAALLSQAGLLRQCELSASDVEPALLTRARTGLVDAAAIPRIPESMLQTCFSRQLDHRVRLDQSILGRIDFSLLDLLEPPAAVREFDIFIANNVLVHFPASHANRMLELMIDRVQPGGLLCIGGLRQDALRTTIETGQLHTVTTCADAIFNGWTLQRHAWYVNPRPYWALPPARMSADEPWRHTALFARNADTARQLDRHLRARVSAAA